MEIPIATYAIRHLPSARARTTWLATVYALFFGLLSVFFIAADRGAFIEPIREYRGRSLHGDPLQDSRE